MLFTIYYPSVCIKEHPNKIIYGYQSVFILFFQSFLQLASLRKRHPQCHTVCCYNLSFLSGQDTFLPLNPFHRRNDEGAEEVLLSCRSQRVSSLKPLALLNLSLKCVCVCVYIYIYIYIIVYIRTRSEIFIKKSKETFANSHH